MSYTQGLMAATWARAIVVGASSGIGAALARRLAQEGCRLALVARRGNALEALATEIASAGGDPPRARAYAHDVTRGEETPALFQQICRDLGGLDLIIYSAGVMPRVAEDAYAFEKDRDIVEVNLLGAIAWLNEAAQRFARAGEGTIVGLSSVSGDRGRRGQPVYCASKAALDAYLESLRNRLRRRGVAVVTVKPGPVDTPMTQGLDRRPLLISADEAARRILRAARRRTVTTYVPGVWRPIMFALRHIPSLVFSRLDV
jgi:decaprenylphospho-beta-D-erythro-pentofuranosid-2-ulose 2-reductase